MPDDDKPGRDGQDVETTTATDTAAQPAKRTRSRKQTAEPPAEPAQAAADAPAPAKRTRSRKKTAAAEPPAGEPAEGAAQDGAEKAPKPRKQAASRRRPAKTAEPAAEAERGEGGPAAPPPPVVLFQPPEPAAEEAPAPRKRTRKQTTAAQARAAEEEQAEQAVAEAAAEAEQAEQAEQGEGEGEEGTGARRRRRRGRRGRGRSRQGGEGGAEGEEQDEEGEAGGETGETPAKQPTKQPQRQQQKKPEKPEEAAEAAEGEAEGEEGTGTRRRRRRSRGRGGAGAAEGGESSGREEREDEVRGIKGSTRMEAKRQRRREGRESSRRRPPIVTEAEFLARRESVDRVLVVREGADRTQIGVLEDGVLVEHYMTRSQATSYVGNVYLGRVQNVLPSMEAAFVDIGKGRNAVLYAGEVNYDASQLEGRPQRIEQALKSGQSVLVQVTKDPIGHKGARLTSQVSLPGRFMVYVPDGRMTGISRKLPDTERTRLKGILKRINPEDAGIIIRTAAEGATEEQLTRDLARLRAQWEDIQRKAESANAPALIYEEPDLVIRVVRDIFNEDFGSVVVQGEDEWDMVEAYISHVAPDLRERLSRWTGAEDVFSHYRVDEQLAKALDRKVWLPSGGSLVIDRTEAMTVVDVNTGKFTGSGGNLEETVTRNNLEAAEEIVRQLRLRDIGGIIVIDFIDMVLESNRELVLRRLIECLGRDRTKHQVAEVTSLGLVQMTRKRIGQGLIEAFSQTCPECHGRGVKVTIDPFEPAKRKGGHAHVHAPAPVAADVPVEEPAASAPAPETAPGEAEPAAEVAGEAAQPEPEAAPAKRTRRGGGRRKPAAGQEQPAEEPAAAAGGD